jgi:hypothetical protein
MMENLVEWRLTGEPKYSEKTCPSTTLSTTNPTWPDSGSNPGRRGGKPATNHLSYGTASSVTYYSYYLLWDNTLKVAMIDSFHILSISLFTINHSYDTIQPIHYINKQTNKQNKLRGFSLQANYVYRPSDRRLSANLVPTFADRGCHVVSATNPHGC